MSRPPPRACRADTTPHSAHKASPYEAFSTLQPVITWPSSVRAAAPTGKPEYGAYDRGIIWLDAARVHREIGVVQVRPARHSGGPNAEPSERTGPLLQHPGKVFAAERLFSP